MSRALDVHKRESMALEKDTFYWMWGLWEKAFTSISEGLFFLEPQDII